MTRPLQKLSKKFQPALPLAEWSLNNFCRWPSVRKKIVADDSVIAKISKVDFLLQLPTRMGSLSVNNLVTNISHFVLVKCLAISFYSVLILLLSKFYF
jgi:hypothetical protein